MSHNRNTTTGVSGRGDGWRGAAGTLVSGTPPQAVVILSVSATCAPCFNGGGGGGGGAGGGGGLLASTEKNGLKNGLPLLVIHHSLSFSLSLSLSLSFSLCLSLYCVEMLHFHATLLVHDGISPSAAESHLNPLSILNEVRQGGML